jgi:hypothetical protein
MSAANDLTTIENDVATDAVEKDKKGIGYIISLAALYLTFFISMIIIAWFGIFSEV